MLMKQKLLPLLVIVVLVVLALPTTGQPLKNYETQVNSFKLYDDASLAKYAFQIDKQRNRIKDSPEDWEDIIFVNRDHTSHLRLIHHPGDAEYEMAGFEVREGMPDEDENYYASVPDKVFMTPHGIMLGLKENEVIDIQGKPQEVFQEGDYKVYRYYDGRRKSWILRKYNQVGYIIMFWFRDGVLERYSFGFEYP